MTKWQRLVAERGIEALVTPGVEHLGGFTSDGLEYWGFWEYAWLLHNGRLVGDAKVDWNWQWGPTLTA